MAEAGGRGRTRPAPPSRPEAHPGARPGTTRTDRDQLIKAIPEQSLSIVIPTLDAAGSLPAVLAACAEVAGAELVVADGGSRDGTAALAGQLGARVVRTAAPGRGGQLAAGAAAARSDWLLFLHADTRPDPGWAASVRAFMAGPGRAGRAAAYFAFALDDDSPAARRLERWVAWRCRMLALPYGDQGLLLPRALYEAVGGFRPLPLMED